MVANTYFFIMISMYFLILVITSRSLEVLTLTDMEKIRGVFLEKYLGFQQQLFLSVYKYFVNTLVYIFEIQLLILSLFIYKQSVI